MLRFITQILFVFLWLLPLSARADAGLALDLADKKLWDAARIEATKDGSNALKILIDWQYVRERDSGATFEDITQFMQAHPDWPDQKLLRANAERLIRLSSIADQDIVDYFTASEPTTGVGKWTYVEALKRLNQKPDLRKKLIKEAWRDADLSEADENQLLLAFGDQLSNEDHIARIDRLLWDGRATAAQHLVGKVPVAYQTLFAARIALIKDEPRAGYLIKQVPAKLSNDPGLIFERMRYRARRGDNKGVREMLLAAPKDVPNSNRWWKLRAGQIRDAIDDGDYQIATKLLANHGQVEGAELAEAEWLSGWLKLSFLGDAKGAYPSFYKMYDAVKTPVSKARGAYWAGRAAKASGDTDTANNWFNTASAHPTTFYGQLAYYELHPDSPLVIPDEPSLDRGSIPGQFSEAITLCVKAGNIRLANKLIRHVIENTDDENVMLAVASLGHSLDAPHISVKAAKRALQCGTALTKTGYPRPKLDDGLAVEPSLALAIVRQESEFDPAAESPSGAHGMMQLLRGTAKEVAKKSGIDYNESGLNEPAYNMQLGCLYLSRMIEAFGGSYVEAIASYNAGPGNVKKWIAYYGSPPQNLYGTVDWIEKIPFEETRNYVQRVMENLQVYRTLESRQSKLQIADDLLK